MPIGKKFGAMQRNGIGPLLISHRYKYRFKLFFYPMRTVFLSLFLTALVLLTLSISNDSGKRMPAVTLKNMQGNTVNSSEISNDGNPVVILFWSSWCKICKSELNTIAEEYDTWQEEAGVKIIAVSVDDQKTANSVESVVNAAGWEYEIWMDTNSELKRAMGVSHTPHWFVLDGNLEITYSHNNFVPGDEELLYEKILEVSSK